ncbi:MAG: folylpolyglutamate synthase/dihydrofolate synthase family protein [Pseudomonadales bacterium]
MEDRSKATSLQRQIADKIVVVAGTNGKGSSVAALEQLLIDSGKRVGVYTSPHFKHYNERFRIAGIDASDQSICAALHKVEHAREDIALTYFEFSTLVALELFAEASLDVAILEVGLGGRLDAVNIVHADVALITRIDLDHQDWLGDTRELIGAEKAGVLREGILFVCADIDPPVSIVEIAENLSVSCHLIGEHFTVSQATQGFTMRTAAGADHAMPDIGLHPASMAAAVQTAELLGLSPSRASVASSLAQVSLPGRQQLIYLGGQAMLLDVAHNPSAVTHLRASFETGARLSKANRTLAVFSVMADKDWSEMVDIIHDVIDEWFLAKLPGNERAEAPQVIADYVQKKGQGQLAQCVDDVAKGLDSALLKAQQMSADGMTIQVLVFGSFFTVAAAMEHIADIQNG